MKEYKNAVWNEKKTPDGKLVDKNIQVEIDGVVSFVANDENDSDYIEIMKQVADCTLTIKDAD